MNKNFPTEYIDGAGLSEQKAKEPFVTIESSLEEKAKSFGFDLNDSVDSILPIVFNLRMNLLKSLAQKQETAFSLKALFLNTDFSNLINEKNIYDFTHVLDEMLRFLVDREISKKKLQKDIFDLITQKLTSFDFGLPQEVSLENIVQETILSMNQNISHKDVPVLREIIRKIWDAILQSLARDFTGSNQEIMARLAKEINFNEIIQNNKIEYDTDGNFILNLDFETEE